MADTSIRNSGCGRRGPRGHAGPTGPTGPTGPSGGGGPSPNNTQIVYVNKGGSDLTGDGSFAKPFLTIQAAMTAITDADKPKRYQISIGPGEYDDPFQLKPWVYVASLELNTTRINGAITLSPLWNPVFPFATDVRAGFANIVFTIAETFDFNTVSSNEGKLEFDTCAFDALLSISAFSAINQWTFNGCRFFSDFSQLGGSVTLANTFFQNGGTISITSVDDGRNLPTLFEAFGGGTDGGITAIWNPSTGSNALNIGCLAFAVWQVVSLSGTGMSYQCGEEAYPLPGNLVLLNGAAPPFLLTGPGIIQQGVATLGAGGTVVVPSAVVTGSTKFSLTAQEGPLMGGALQQTARVPGVSFTVSSTSPLDAGVNFFYQLWS